MFSFFQCRKAAADPLLFDPNVFPPHSQGFLFIVNAMHLQRNETFQGFIIFEFRRGHAVDPRANDVALGLDAKVVPSVGLESLARVRPSFCPA